MSPRRSSPAADVRGVRNEYFLAANTDAVEQAAATRMNLADFWALSDAERDKAALDGILDYPRLALSAQSFL